MRLHQGFTLSSHFFSNCTLNILTNKHMLFMPVAPQHLTLVFALIFLTAGCSGSRSGLNTGGDLPAGFPNHSYEQIVHNLTSHPFPVEAYLSESALAIKSPAQSGSFSASITHKKNDSLLISISPGLGIIAVRALVTPDSFYVHDRINKELAVGTIEDMQRLLPFPTDSASLYSSLLGVWLPVSSPEWELTTDKGYYILKDADARHTLFIDPIYWRVVRYIEKTSNGQLIEERTFSEFEDFDGIYLPRRLTFRRPGDDTSASLYHRKLTLNPSSLAFDFNVSNSVKRINF